MWSSTDALRGDAGAVILPSGKGFPGTSSGAPASTDSKAVCFATAGEKGVVKVWSAGTGQCVYEQSGQGSIEAGNLVELALLPGGSGLMTASADCNLQFYKPQVTLLPGLSLTKHSAGCTLLLNQNLRWVGSEL